MKNLLMALVMALSLGIMAQTVIAAGNPEAECMANIPDIVQQLKEENAKWPAKLVAVYVCCAGQHSSSKWTLVPPNQVSVAAKQNYMQLKNSQPECRAASFFKVFVIYDDGSYKELPPG
jgi:hypothetical protein